VSIARYINYSETRPEFVQLFQNFRGGVGGPCSVYDPPFSYWCAEETQGGGKAQFTLPGGVVYSPAQLPHAPYKNATGAVYVPFGLCSGHVRVRPALHFRHPHAGRCALLEPYADWCALPDVTPE